MKQLVASAPPSARIASAAALHVRRVGGVAGDLEGEVRLDRDADVGRAAGVVRPAAAGQLLRRAGSWRASGMRGSSCRPRNARSRTYSDSRIVSPSSSPTQWPSGSRRGEEAAAAALDGAGEFLGPVAVAVGQGVGRGIPRRACGVGSRLGILSGVAGRLGKTGTPYPRESACRKANRRPRAVARSRWTAGRNRPPTSASRDRLLATSADSSHYPPKESAFGTEPAMSLAIDHPTTKQPLDPAPPGLLSRSAALTRPRLAATGLAAAAGDRPATSRTTRPARNGFGAFSKNSPSRGSSRRSRTAVSSSREPIRAAARLPDALRHSRAIRERRDLPDSRGGSSSSATCATH